MTPEEIEKRSRVQKRGRFSNPVKSSESKESTINIDVESKDSTSVEAQQLSLFDFFPQD